MVKKCLIIAAGRGSRLVEISSVKPLTILLGLSLIERIIYTIKRVGIYDIYIVLGHKNEKIASFLNSIISVLDVNITYIYNIDWEKGNGLSVLKARDYISEEFLLLMSDHIFDFSILNGIMEIEMKEDEVVLAVDYKISCDLIELTDVTKVNIKGNTISSIGKNISNYNAFDTGIFRCTPFIFKAIEENYLLTGDDSLSGGINYMAKMNLAKTYNIENKFWIDIDDSIALKKAEKLLFKAKSLSDGLVSKYINRKISYYLTKELIKTNILPNHITFISFLLTIFSSFLFLSGGRLSLLIGGVIAQFASIIDGCDGEVARIKLKETKFGEWLDYVLDRYGEAFLLFGLTFHICLLENNLKNITYGVFAIIGIFMNSYLLEKYKDLMKEKVKYEFSNIYVTRDVRIFFIFIGALLDIPVFVLLTLAIVMNFDNFRILISQLIKKRNYERTIR